MAPHLNKLLSLLHKLCFFILFVIYLNTTFTLTDLPRTLCLFIYFTFVHFIRLPMSNYLDWIIIPPANYTFLS